ncbi:hypothetical protein J2S98_001878 [Arthrobacter oryzae]|uniref:hypothetical protein n=1 Tax=Arthrobacter TaxID=1663 RepID=UPI001F3D868B|nr:MULTISPECIES: hypothetical protein [Arthrobacter]MDP9986721.1 hypothetical protein [Arthrobacter oryzae]UKA72368.1 hypothetical protein LFT49_06425 [Arthrobacter sp. FW306-06-A]
MTLLQAPPNRLLLACSAALVAAGFLSACAAPGNGLQREAATQLQARVLEVTQASSQNNPESALQALAGLEADLSAAQAKGQVSEERRRSITTVATAVRADLNDILAAQKAAAAKASEDARIAAEQAAQSAAPAPVQPAPAPAPAQGSSGSNGPASGKNNNDKGKGKN